MSGVMRRGCAPSSGARLPKSASGLSAATPGRLGSLPALAARAWLTAAALVGCVSGIPFPGTVPPPCLSDDECSAGQVCFVDGCGDPGEGLVFEIVGNTAVGQYAQDFPADDGGLSGRLDFVLNTPLWLTGTLHTETADGGDPSGRVPFSGDVLVRAVGESEYLPGLSRSFESRFEAAQITEGRFEMPLGPGRYTVSATAAEVTVPPVFLEALTLRASVEPPPVALTFPAPSRALALGGRLLRQSSDAGTPVDLGIDGPGYDVQAFDPVSRRALSQRTPVGSVGPLGQGGFSLSLHPAAAALPRVEVVATPRQLRALAPTKSFLLGAPFPMSTVLELGAYGQPLPGVRGRVVDARGSPIEGAAVVTGGTVAGGGLFRSATVLTDAEGWFSVDLLPSDSVEGHVFTVVPPPEARAARAEVRAGVLPPEGSLPRRLGRDIACGERTAVRGRVLTPDGAPATSITVRAVPTAIDAAPSISAAVAETVTGADGAFELWVDAGDYRLDFIVETSGAQTSRAIRIAPPSGASGTISSIELSAITLPRWRRLGGTVLVQSRVRALAPVPFAVVRAFRLGSVNERPTAVVLGQAVADSSGEYSILLPTR